jgi:hypothetical protein
MKILIRWTLRVIVFLGLAILSLSMTSVALTPETLQPSHHLDKAAIRVYGADVWGIRGRFAIHTWIATKTANQDTFTLHEIIGWKLRRNDSALTVSLGRPDRPWFNSPALLLYEVTGEAAEAMIPDVHDAIYSYPYAQSYTMWPGPNSNSFTEWVSLKVPALKLELPVKAIGRSWMIDNYGDS